MKNVVPKNKPILKKTMLFRRMYRNDIDYAIQHHSFSALNYYYNILSGFAPEEVSISWVENLVFILPEKNPTEFERRLSEVMTWANDAYQNPEFKPSFLFDVRHVISILLGKVRSPLQKLFDSSPLLKDQLSNGGLGEYPHPEAIKVKDESHSTHY